jgi:putative ABC transport system substrate-binding protein
MELRNSREKRIGLHSSIFNKRKFFALIVSASFLGLLFLNPFHAQASDKITVGVIFSADIPFYREIHNELVNRLVEKGLIDKVQILVQKPNPDQLAWSNAVRKVIAYDASIIVAYGSGASSAAKLETRSLPILIAGVYNPSKLGLNGKNIGGVGYRVPVSSILRYFRKAKEIERLGILYSEFDKGSKVQRDEVRKSCEMFSIKNVDLPVTGKRDMKDKIGLTTIDSLFLTDGALIARYFPDIHPGVMKLEIPVVTTLAGYEDLSLITLSPNSVEQGSIVADQLMDIITKGKKAALKIQVIRRNTLTFNLKLAKELGIEVPIELLTESDRIIR